MNLSNHFFMIHPSENIEKTVLYAIYSKVFFFQAAKTSVSLFAIGDTIPQKIYISYKSETCAGILCLL